MNSGTAVFKAFIVGPQNRSRGEQEVARSEREMEQGSTEGKNWFVGHFSTAFRIGPKHFHAFWANEALGAGRVSRRTACGSRRQTDPTRFIEPGREVVTDDSCCGPECDDLRLTTQARASELRSLPAHKARCRPISSNGSVGPRVGGQDSSRETKGLIH